MWHLFIAGAEYKSSSLNQLLLLLALELDSGEIEARQKITLVRISEKLALKA